MKKHIIEEPDDESLAAYLPLKNHIKRLEEMLSGLKGELDDDYNEIDKVKRNIRDMGDAHNKEQLQLHNQMIDHCQRLVHDIRDMNTQSKQETYNLKQQLASLNQDKIRMQQNLIVLENRVNETDKDIGFKRRSRAANKKK